MVWLCIDSGGNEYAAKQISKKPKPTENALQIHVSHHSQMAKREIQIMKHISSLSQSHPILQSMITFHESLEDNNDIWLICEKGGRSLSNLCLKVKGEFINSERIYTIQKGKFLQKMISDLSQFKHFIRHILEFLSILSSHKIVHSDIKPDNILIEYDWKTFEIKQIKIIDFGSAYFLDNPVNFASNTPEYTSPEITKHLEKGSTSKETKTFLSKLMDYPWCVDIWSFGVALLEIVLACPLWMSYKAKVVIRGKAIFKTGLFGVKCRDGGKIHAKQLEISKSVSKLLNECLIDDVKEREMFGDLLSKMLEIDYKKRISPQEALKHPFLK